MVWSVRSSERELQEIFAGDRSVEPARVTEVLEISYVEGGGHQETSTEMAPESGENHGHDGPFLSREESDELFTQDLATQDNDATYTLTLTSVPELDDDATVIDETGDIHTANQSQQCGGVDDVEDDPLPEPNPRDTYSSRMRQSLTEAEREALITRRKERTSVEKMADKMVKSSNNQLDRILEHSWRALDEDKLFHKSFVNCSREFFSIFREQTNILRELADTVVKKPNNQRSAAVRKRMGVRERIRDVPYGDNDSMASPSTSGVDVSFPSPEPQCAYPLEIGCETPSRGESSISIPLRNQAPGKVRPQRVIKKPSKLSP